MLWIGLAFAVGIIVGRSFGALGVIRAGLTGPAAEGAGP